MATVHRAILRGMGGFKREVVIKRILSDLAKDEHFIKMFIEEAKLSALLDHPNIVQVYDFGVIDDHYYISMEFIDGLSLLKLRKHYRRRAHFPPEAAALIMHQVCLGLDYTHRLTKDGHHLGLVHRDVSPSNIMVSAHGEVKLLDFGIAKAVEAIDDEVTRTGTLKGKWSYMSPEQVVGATVTFRADIFACGIVLWEILTGRRLFKDKTDFLTLSNVANARVPEIGRFRPELPPLFDQICRRALAREPQDRFSSAEEMADQLWGYLAEYPCTNSHLGSIVAPLMRRGDTEETPLEEIVQEVSDSRSASVSESASESMPQSKESLTSLPRGEQEEVIIPHYGHRRLLTLATLGFVLASVVIVVLLFALRPGGRGPSTAATSPETLPDTEPTTAPKPKPEPPKPAPEPAKVTVHVKTTPKGALIRLATEKKARGAAPLTLTLPRSEKPLQLIASLPNHRVAKRELVPDSDKRLTLTLEPVFEPEPVEPSSPPEREIAPTREPEPATAARETAQPKPKPGPRPTVVRPRQPSKPPRRRPARRRGKAPNLKSGDLADPYGDW
jgi:serine/threonine protein kinase